MNLTNYATQSPLTEKLTFFRKFIESPSQVGSIAPSSRFLAEKMLEPIDWKNTRAVAELGAGTGALTKQIHTRKHPNCRVAVFEKDKQMRNSLSKMYPDLNYFEDARQLSLNTRSIDMNSLDVVVSGLPFALFEKDVREQIIDEVIKSLKPNGVFIAFQYSLQMKNLLDNKFLSVTIAFAPLNLPPAFVYVCQK